MLESQAVEVTRAQTRAIAYHEAALSKVAVAQKIELNTVYVLGGWVHASDAAGEPLDPSDL
jgi:hypothetical protein